MLYVGLDVHLRTSSWCILDQNGKTIKEETLRGDIDAVVARLSEIREAWSVCFEASCGYGTLYEKLIRVAQRVVVAHPGRLRLIFKSKKKFDRVDGRKLAKILYLDEVPQVWVPPVQVRKWREVVEFRKRLTQKQTCCKSQLKALMRGLGIRKIVVSGADLELPRKGSAKASVHPGLWGKRGMELLAKMELPTAYDGLRRDVLLEELAQLQRQVAVVEKELNAMAAGHPGVALLRTIPGVGPRTAEAVLAYVGDPQRFSNNKKVGAYAGLVPCEDSSGGAQRLGHITREGPGTLRWLLVEAAWQAVRLSPTIKAYYERISKRHPDHKKIALVATAHHLLRVMLSMLKSGEPWREDPAQVAAAEQAKETKK
jgi:transposase